MSLLAMYGLNEVDDFIDFLKIKRKSEWDWLSKGIDKIEESEFKDYLEGLTSYEDMLAKGEIRWK
jgi:hypothetical protein